MLNSLIIKMSSQVLGGLQLKHCTTKIAFFKIDMQSVTGFLNPYKVFDENTQASRYVETVPTTIDRCALFEACPKYTFFVDNNDHYTKSGDGAEVRNQANNDIENCGSVKFFEQTGDSFVVWSPAISNIPQPLSPYLPMSSQLTHSNLQLLHQDNGSHCLKLLQHCPSVDAKFADFRAVAPRFPSHTHPIDG